MSIGFISPHPIFGRGVPVDAGRSAGPLPFIQGVPSAATIGRGNGPLPFGVGVSAETIGRGHGPLPFILGVVGVPVVVVPPTVGGGGGGYVAAPPEWIGKRPDRLIERIRQDDDDLLEILMIVVTSGKLD